MWDDVYGSRDDFCDIQNALSKRGRTTGISYDLVIANSFTEF